MPELYLDTVSKKKKKNETENICKIVSLKFTNLLRMILVENIYNFFCSKKYVSNKYSIKINLDHISHLLGKYMYWLLKPVHLRVIIEANNSLIHATYIIK